MDELRQHKSSDKVKWFLTLIAFILMGLTLAGLITGYIVPQEPKEILPSTEQTEEANIDVGCYLAEYVNDFIC